MMAEAAPGDVDHEPVSSKNRELLALLEIWRDSKRDPLEFSKRIANLSLEDPNDEKTLR